MKRAVHRLYDVILPFYVHRGEEVFSIKIPVSALLPETYLRYMRGVDDVVRALYVLGLPEVFDNAPDSSAVRMPQDETGADVLTRAEEVKLASEFSMVSLLRLFKTGKILVKAGLR